MINGLQPSLAEGGKIKIGGKGKEIKSRKGNKFRPPEKYDHFIITTTTRDRAGDLIVDTELMQALLDDDWGDDDGKLRKIPITVHEDTFDKIMPTFYAAYAGKKLACRGDGQVATRYRFNDRRERLDETFE
ncbi:MAG: hypothetical protein GTN70_03710, partial [Deltaproteobacteria bacterium]|nr:hypothetical protein [Deltaproteobacteria bacterium]